MIGIAGFRRQELIFWEDSRQIEIAAAPQADNPAVETAAPPTASEFEPEPSSDDPRIEPARCTTCNQCTQINNRMFAYNENKQAYIADPGAGTCRKLVLAAESCRPAIIHPGEIRMSRDLRNGPPAPRLSFASADHRICSSPVIS